MTRTTLRSLCGCFALLASIVLAAPGFAALTGLSIEPEHPTICDSVTITARGTLPTSCYDIVWARLRGPVQVQCVTEPCPVEFFVDIKLREPNPAETCLAQDVPYERSFKVAPLPPGVVVVFADERTIAWDSPDTSNVIVSRTERLTTFTVSQDTTCVPGTGCYILNMHDPLARLDGPCDGSTAPGGTACLPVNLTNNVPVGGVQTTVSVQSITTQYPAGSFRISSVEAVRRAAGFQVAWSGEGNRVKILLYSTAGQTIPPGDGPVLRVCYAVGPETPPSRYWVVNEGDIVADPQGNALRPCPTPAIFAPGVLCVVTPGCDPNGDGVSDVLDIIRIAQCALGSPNDTIPCPASTDCNGDGPTDIRDVLCCVRKILRIPVGNGGIPYPTGFAPDAVNQIGFVGPIRWTTPISGLASLRIDTAPDWGGTQFSIDTHGAPVRIRALKLVQAPAGVEMEYAVGQDGIARAMLYAGTVAARSAWSGRIEVTVDRTSPEAGAVSLTNLKAGTAAGGNAGIYGASPTLSIEVGAPSAAPQLFRARPNPFNASTEIAFVLPAGAGASLRIYDVHGRLVRSLVEGATQGPHLARWDGTDERGRAARSGIYFANLTVGATTRSERILLMR